MEENKEQTIFEKHKKSKKNNLIVVYIVLATLVVFVLGYGVGTLTSSDVSVSTSSNSELTNLEIVMDYLSENFYYGEDSSEYRSQLIIDAIKGMVDAQGDAFTEYYTPEELAEFTSSLESTIVGIGIRYVEFNGNIFIVEPLSNSPAAQAGLQAGDIIIAVEGVYCKDNDLDDMAEMISGEIGTEVTVTVLRNDETFDVTIVRDEVDTTVTSEIRDNIGILTISSFGTGTATEVKTHLEAFEEAGVDELIIDLRDNGGGYLSTLQDMCAYFMDDGDVIMIEEDRDGNETYIVVEGSDKYEYNDIIVIINEDSASCSEVFTLALIENCGAITVGTTSYGKGVAQVSRVFSDGSGLKYTDVIWKSGNGVYIHGTGITPDYEVELHDALNTSYITMEEDEVYSYDCVDDKVAYVQTFLDFLGYDVERCDGYFDESTVEAIEQYQEDTGITITGEVDYETVTSLTTTVRYTWYTQKDVYDTQMQKALELVNG